VMLTLSRLRLGFGGASLAGSDVSGPPAAIDSAKAALATAIDYGVDLIDTAPSYGPEWSERLVGEVLRQCARHPVIATKAGVFRTGRGQWAIDVTPDRMRKTLEESLARLGVDAVDLLQLHHPSARIAIEETMETLAAFRVEGLARHIGVCNVSLDQLRRAQRVVEVAAVQNYLHVLRVTQADLDLVAECSQLEIPFMAYQPLGEGNLLRETRVVAAANRQGVSPLAVALGGLWELSPTVVPLVGSSDPVHVRELLKVREGCEG
jgi:pyridoxine 4-dehydrogenase